MGTKLFYFVLILLISVPSHTYSKTPGDPFLGDYEGIFTSRGKYPLNGNKSKCVAEVFPIGNNEYSIRFMEAFGTRAEILARTKGAENNQEIIFSDSAARGKISGDVIKGEMQYLGDWIGFQLIKVVRSSVTMGAKPTSEAIILFDGSGFDEWTTDNDLPLRWKIVNKDEMEVVGFIPNVTPKTDIHTKRQFTNDLYLHLEFKLSLMADKKGQDRSNSGVIFQGVGEIQILDSYGLDGSWNDCGSLYRRSPPKVNMSLPPLSWQTYDIIFHSPRYDENGKLQKHAEITVFHNGKGIHSNYPMKGGPAQLQNGIKNFPVSIRLQDHRDVLWFRNIWAIDLTQYPKLPEFTKNLED